MARTDLETDLRPALDAFAAALAEHGIDFNHPGLGRCLCGWEQTRRTSSPARSRSLHETAARKRAERVFDAAADAVIAQRSGRAA